MSPYTSAFVICCFQWICWRQLLTCGCNNHRVPLLTWEWWTMFCIHTAVQTQLLQQIIGAWKILAGKTSRLYLICCMLAMLLLYGVWCPLLCLPSRHLSTWSLVLPLDCCHHLCWCILYSFGFSSWPLFSLHSSSIQLLTLTSQPSEHAEAVLVPDVFPRTAAQYRLRSPGLSPLFGAILLLLRVTRWKLSTSSLPSMAILRTKSSTVTNRCGARVSRVALQPRLQTDTGCPKIKFTFLKFCSFKSKPPIATPKSYFVRGDLQNFFDTKHVSIGNLLT